MNSATVFFALAAFVATASAGVAGGLGVGGLANDVYAYPRYQYSYGVSDKTTGDIKNAAEVRDGGVTKGSYSLVQPDGVLRTVNYISTPLGGFQAQVINTGAAGHPSVGLGYGGQRAGLGLGAVGGIGYAGLGGARSAVAVGGLGGYGSVGLASPLGVGIGARSVVGGLGLGGYGAGLGAGIIG